MFVRLLLAVILVVNVNARTIPCLDGCQCESSEQDPVIRCDNLGLTRFPLPTTPLTGYNFLALTCNDISELPSASMIQASFPDIHGIDVQGNAKLNCSQLKHLEDVVPVLSDCMHASEPLQCDHIDTSCDWKCSTLKKMKDLWARFKAAVSRKIKEWGAEETVSDVSDWFSRQFQKLSIAFGNFASEHRDEPSTAHKND